MKRLNETEWEIMHWALSVKQLEEIQMKGSLTLNKQQAIETLKESIKVTDESRKMWQETLANGVSDKKVEDMLVTCINNSKIRDNDEKGLLNKLENDNDDYIIGFMKGNRG